MPLEPHARSGVGGEVLGVCGNHVGAFALDLAALEVEVHAPLGEQARLRAALGGVDMSLGFLLAQAASPRDMATSRTMIARRIDGFSVILISPLGAERPPCRIPHLTLCQLWREVPE